MTFKTNFAIGTVTIPDIPKGFMVCVCSFPLADSLCLTKSSLKPLYSLGGTGSRGMLRAGVEENGIDYMSFITSEWQRHDLTFHFQMVHVVG